MIRVDNIKLPTDHTEKDLRVKLEKILKPEKNSKRSEHKELTYRILRQSIDARKKPEIFYVYSVAVETGEPEREEKIIRNLRNRNVSKYAPLKYELPSGTGKSELKGSPVIVGSGPAGLFCAYVLCRCGYAPIVLERGECVEERIKSVENFWNTGVLKTDSNVQFGEGGAGTFSDGKLNTGVNDKKGRNQYVLDTFVSFGAPEEISYKSKPHIGTDILIDVVRNMREYIKENGGCFRFDTKMTGIETDDKGVCAVLAGDQRIETNCLVLAIGHSARDTFKMLRDLGIEMVQKDFAVGLRIQHPQDMIDRSQYGMNTEDCRRKGLPAADYKLVNHTSNGRNVYTFCMCPGGYVVNASSEAGRLAVNGMSYSGRNSLNANSAVIVGVGRDDFASNDVLAGMEFQRRIEEKAYKLGNGRIPVQNLGDFRGDDKSAGQAGTVPCFKGGYEYADLRELFTEDITEALIESIDKFSYTIKDFARTDALLAGVESRTSSPVRILRNEELVGSLEGLYPCGEGAGYAGGITSAAMDGIKVAEKITEKYKPIEGRFE